jgi:hypothetical protein
VTEEMKNGRSPTQAVAAALPRLRGAFALAFLFGGENDVLIGARKGSPLAIGYGDGEMYLGSDAIALAPFTDTISYLEDGDSAVLTRKSVLEGLGKRRRRGRLGCGIDRVNSLADCSGLACHETVGQMVGRRPQRHIRHLFHNQNNAYKVPSPKAFVSNDAALRLQHARSGRTRRGTR